MTERQEQKAKALAALRQRVPRCAERLGDIDPRLAAYFQGLCDHASAEPADEDDLHNYYEILGGLKFLRMLYDYTFNTKIVKAIIRMGEGEWQQDGKMGATRGLCLRPEMPSGVKGCDCRDKITTEPQEEAILEWRLVGG